MLFISILNKLISYGRGKKKKEKNNGGARAIMVSVVRNWHST